MLQALLAVNWHVQILESQTAQFRKCLCCVFPWLAGARVLCVASRKLPFLPACRPHGPGKLHLCVEQHA